MVFTSILLGFFVLNGSFAFAQYRILFIHHSCGGNWLADGNGNLRQELTKQGFEVHDATYGDKIGQETDVCHWYPKFRDQYKLIITFDRHANTYYQHGEENDIIMFKSCFPNSDIVSEGTAPGNPKTCIKTLWNYKATYKALAKIFSQHPEKLFIPVTAPPLVPRATKKGHADRARQFNNWLKTKFMKNYYSRSGLRNVAVFDFYNVLADSNNYLKKEYRRNNDDSHPNKIGNRAATAKFIPFIKKAVSQWEKSLKNKNY